MTYNPSGNINRGGTIIISYRNYKYEIIFQLGRGDLRIVKCQKGSIMAEMIVSLSVLMMAVSLLLPQTVLVMQERKNIQIRYKATGLLKKAAIYMYGNEDKRIIEKNINGIVLHILGRQ